MNRKEGVIVGLVLLVSFIGGAFAAPAIQNTFITNDPLNVRIVGGTTSLRTTSVDIDILILLPLLGNGIQIVSNPVGQGAQLNYTASFSFAPLKGFVQVNNVLATLVYTPQSPNPGNSIGVQLNGQSIAGTLIDPLSSGAPTSSIAAVGGIRVGSNIITVKLILATSSGVLAYLYEVRLTVEYTFLG